MNYGIIHFNTPELTNALVLSINKHCPNARIFLFDNSTKKKFQHKHDNLVYIDNTNGGIINFKSILSKYPNRMKSLGRYSDFGSFKHCISVDKLFDIIGEPFILLDSDVLLKKNPEDIADDSIYWSGEVVDWGWGLLGHKGNYPVTKRIKPFITYINVPMLISNGYRYYNDHHMVGLWNPDVTADSYDTGSWLYEQTKNTGKFKEIKFTDYVVHYGGGSYRGKGSVEHLSKDKWLAKYNHLYLSECKSNESETLKKKNAGMKPKHKEKTFLYPAKKKLSSSQIGYKWQTVY